MEPGFAPGVASDVFRAAAERLESSNGVRRIWERDASLWTGADEGRWLGWLDLPFQPESGLDPLRALAREACREGVRDVVVMGMGGSSLCPDVLARCFEPAPGHPRTRVLDSTVPAQIRALDAALDLETTWFVVPSKSGGTIEPNSFLAHFHARAVDAFGEAGAGARFVAVTDPGSSLETVARERGFRAIVPGIPSVGGRFSALSAFGLLPAALQGLDLEDWLARARAMAERCGPAVTVADDPGAELGLALGALAAEGRDKLHLSLSPRLASLGGWLEQLVAESTGKQGRGIVPIDGEPLPAPAQAGDDRLFVHTRLRGDEDADQERALDALAGAGQPVLCIELDDARDLAGEMFRWEIATAVAGAVLGLNPFDQPDVEAAKVEARSLMAAYEDGGALPDRPATLVEGDLRAWTDPGLGAPAAGGNALEALLAAHFARAVPGDYVAINAYLPMDAAHGAALDRLRRTLAERLPAPTTLGYGPRFLHSTGQLHKGGSDAGLFLQLTSDDAADLPIPGQRYSFGVLKQAQALGDFAVLCERGRRALRLHLPADSAGALARLTERIERAVAARR